MSDITYRENFPVWRAIQWNGGGDVGIMEIQDFVRANYECEIKDVYFDGLINGYNTIFIDGYTRDGIWVTHQSVEKGEYIVISSFGGFAIVPKETFERRFKKIEC